MTQVLSIVAVVGAVSLALCPADATARDATDRPTTAEKRFAMRFAQAAAADVRAHPPRAPLARIVVRWSDPEQPGDFTFHALGERERRRVRRADAWLPLEWQNVDRELSRSDRLGRTLRASARALERRYGAHAGEVPDETTPSGDRLAPPAVLSVLRRLPKALRRAGVPLAEHFSVSAAHFEGDGALPTLRRIASPKLLAVLKTRGELPRE